MSNDEANTYLVSPEIKAVLEEVYAGADAMTAAARVATTTMITQEEILHGLQTLFYDGFSLDDQDTRLVITDHQKDMLSDYKMDFSLLDDLYPPNLIHPMPMMEIPVLLEEPAQGQRLNREQRRRLARANKRKAKKVRT